MTPQQRITIRRDGEYLRISVIEDGGASGEHGAIRIHEYIEDDFSRAISAMTWDECIDERVIDSDTL